MNKIRVLHIITRLDPGGSSTNTIETVARLDPQQFETFLISGRTNDPDGSIELSLKKKNISYLFFPDLQRNINGWKDAKAFFQLYGFMKRRHFDIVHTHTSKAGILGRWAAKSAGVKYIIHTPHGHIFYGYFGKLKTLLFIWLERFTAVMTTRIITLTHRGKKEHIDFKIASPDKFVPIYSGIDISSRDQFNKLTFIPQGSFVFGCVARLETIKGISYLIEAMAQVVLQYPQSHLLLVGDGAEKEKLQRHSEALGLKDHITFAGFQKDTDRFIDCMDVFVLASLNEGMGRVILEAMAQGKPVIATKVGGIPELIDDGVNGLLVAPKDADALSMAMIKLLRDGPLLKGMAAQARAKVGGQFSLDHMVKDIECLYLNCFKSGG